MTANLHSIATVSLSGTLDKKIPAIAAAGFRGVEIFENDLLVHFGTPGDVRQMVEDHGLVCTAFQPFRDLEGMPGALRQRAFDRLERKFDLMLELGAELLLVCSNVSPHATGDMDRISADLREAGERAAARGLRIGYEALAWGRHINDHRDAWAVVKMADHEAVGLILDSFHSLARGVPSASIATIDPAKIALVQVADAPMLRMDALSWSRHFRNMPGQGDLPVVDYIAALEAIGYDGPISLEIFNDRFRAGSAAEIAVDGRRSLIFVEDQLARRGNTPELADRISVDGVEFVEFAANEAEAEDLANLFRALGFECTGRHRTKAVTLWSQGSIRLVINSEPISFAHTFDAVHGASICAIGLRIADAEMAVARARALEIPVFQKSDAEVRHAFPAVRGVGGSLLYLVDQASADQVWAGEFEAKDEPADPLGLEEIDHLSQVMFYDEMLSWVLYYTCLFDVAKAVPSEIADPAGLMEVQAVASRDDSLRLVLNTSVAPQSLARRFLERHFGSGIQSVSLNTSDIFHAAEKIRSSGLPVLEIPENYYPDIAARFGLGEELVDRLRENNILYDQDERGEYFQLFTRAYDKRFFFEIVQRRDYQGYGLPNEGVRLAAQARHRDDALAA